MRNQTDRSKHRTPTSAPPSSLFCIYSSTTNPAHSCHMSRSPRSTQSPDSKQNPPGLASSSSPREALCVIIFPEIGCPESHPRCAGSPKRYGSHEQKSVEQGFRTHQPSFLFPGICHLLSFGGEGWGRRAGGGGVGGMGGAEI